jgi:hypothetical protein
VEVGDDERDRLGRLVAQEDRDLLGRRAAQELERAALDRRGQPRALAISSDSDSTSSSLRWRKTSPAFSSPRATTSTAAFCAPVSR